MLQSTLRGFGHDVTFTTSAHDALEQVGREGFAAVLTDLGMAEMGGSSSARESSARAPTPPSSS